MAISIDWATKIIFVPKADLTLIQSTPSEIRELNVNAFRLNLKDIEDNTDGMAFEDTHSHNTEVTLSGIVFARIFSILSPYTVEFEDGQYTVNCVGANHNIADRKIPNQVSLVINNAAGLISNAAIEFSSFNGSITVETTSTFSGTTFPTGTAQAPVNNFSDALLMAASRGFTKINVNGDATVDSGLDYTDLQISGQSVNLSTLTISSDAIVNNCEFSQCLVTGTLDGGSLIKDSIIEDLNYVNGVILSCMLNSGTILLGGGGLAHFLNCSSGVVGTLTPIIDMGGSGQGLALRNYNGGIKLTNKTGADSVSIDINSGQIVLSNTVTGGTIVARGIGKLIDENGDHIHSGTWNGGVTILNELVNTGTITESVWDKTLP